MIFMQVCFRTVKQKLMMENNSFFICFKVALVLCDGAKMNDSFDGQLKFIYPPRSEII